MTTTRFDFELRRTLQLSIGAMLEEVLDLPHWLTINDWTCGELQAALARSRDAVSAVRFLATEFVQLADFDEWDMQSVHAIEYAEQICDLLEAEVDFVQSELMIYAK